VPVIFFLPEVVKRAASSMKGRARVTSGIIGSGREVAGQTQVDASTGAMECDLALGLLGIGISFGEGLRKPSIMPINVVVEISAAVLIHSRSNIQNQHRNL